MFVPALGLIITTATTKSYQSSPSTMILVDKIFSIIVYKKYIKFLFYFKCTNFLESIKMPQHPFYYKTQILRLNTDQWQSYVP